MTIKRQFLVILEAAIISLFVLLSVFPISCKVSTTGLEIIGAGYRVPVLENFSVDSAESITLSFSDEVTLLAASVTPYEDDSSFSSPAIDLSYSPDGTEITASLHTPTSTGKRYRFYGEVENKKGCSLTFSLLFTGYNERIPSLVLTELQDGTTTKGGGEFIEFYALTGGNLAGLKISSVNDGEDADWTFPPVEVKKGDFITVHFRPGTKDNPEDCISETNGNIKESKATGSSDTAWDFWCNSTSSRLGATQDVILLSNSNSGLLLQALVYSSEKKSEWMKEKFAEASEKAFLEGVWAPSGCFDDSFIFKTSPVIRRTNLDRIISDYENGKLTYPFPSSKEDFERITGSLVTPGY